MLKAEGGLALDAGDEGDQVSELHLCGCGGGTLASVVLQPRSDLYRLRPVNPPSNFLRKNPSSNEIKGKKDPPERTTERVVLLLLLLLP